MRNLNIRLSTDSDSDVIEFWKKQPNKTLALKVLTRIIIKKIGVKDILKEVSILERDI
jgi:hypothetical protein